MRECGASSDSVSPADQVFVRAWKAAQPELVARARRLVQGHADRVDDLLANTAIKALLFMRRSPEAITDPEGFLLVVLRHVFLDGTRRSGRDAETFDRTIDVEALGEQVATPTLTALQRLELEEQLTRVVAAVKQMTRDQRRLFAYRFIHDLPYPDIAERMNINQPLVRKRVQLLRQRLKAAVDRDTPLESPSQAATRRV